MLAALFAISVLSPRFQQARPLPALPAILIDSELDGIGIAQQTARAKGLQARILWIDGTANLERTNTEDKIIGLVKKIKSVGFNTIVFDIKPIVGETLYPSAFTAKLKEWKGQTLPLDFDPLKIMVREAKAAGLPLYVSMNAFSEGHALFKLGPGYNKVDQQTVLYEYDSFVQSLDGSKFKIGKDGLSLGPADGDFAVTVDKNLVVQDGFERPGQLKNFPTIPKGGSAISGTGEAALFLRQHATPGMRLKLTTAPLFVPISERPDQQYPLMMNPYHPEVRAHALAIAKEVVTKYDVDGMVYDDRLRFGGLNADFSPEARAAFESSLGQKVANWPEDIFRFTVNMDQTRGIEPGPLYDEWFAFRNATLRDWVMEVRSAITAIKPSLQLGVYAGSFYNDYAPFGQNYGSPDLEAGFWFLTKRYRETGLAPHIDFLMTGCYYPTATIFDALKKGKSIGATVEAAGYLTNRVVRDQTWDYASIALSQFANDPDGLGDALQAACASTQGVMIFDLSHNIEPMWPVFERAFSLPATPPHRTDQLAQIRKRRIALDKMGVKDPPLVIMGGNSGVGF